MANQFEPVRVYSCANCGFAMRQFNPDSELLICESCGTRLGESEADRDEPKLVVPDHPLIKLHGTFTYMDRQWQVIAYQAYEGTVREYDGEDKKWETSQWSYRSWWVLSDRRELRWLLHDPEGFFWCEKGSMPDELPGENDTKYEHGSYRLLGSVGELSYIPSQNERIKSWDWHNMSLEVRMDEDNSAIEVEAFEQWPLHPHFMLEAFGRDDILGIIRERERATKAFFLTLVLIFVTAMVALGYSSSIVPAEAKAIEFSKEDNGNFKNMGTFDVDSHMPMSFKLIKRAISFANGANNQRMADNQGVVEFELIIVDRDNTEIVELPLEFWWESGVDEGKPWLEFNSSVTQVVKLPMGKDYQMHLKLLQMWEGVETIDLKLYIRGAISSVPFLIAGSIALIAGFLSAYAIHLFRIKAAGARFR